MTRIGSLFSGYGGLDLGVRAVIGGDVVWHCEYDKAPSAILAHHYRGVVNFGDVKKVDWSTVEPIDVLTGGYPCQPFSHAGNRKGTTDERHLWPYVALAIGALRPSLIILENVSGHLSLGLGDVLGDLAALGYDATWGVVRAADAGACHQRARVFIVANADSSRSARLHNRAGKASARGDGHSEPRSDNFVTDADGWRWHEGVVKPRDISATSGRGSTAISDGHSPDGTTADASGERYGRRQNAGMVGGMGTASTVLGRSTSAARQESGHRGAEDAADAAGNSGRVGDRDMWATADADIASGEAWRDAGHDSQRIRQESVGLADAVNWGQYGPAIARWADVIGRPAPAPTESGSKGRPRLSPAFVEWMMGLPAGHVTDPAIGISRTAQLKALGNGVVPQQAALALSVLLPLAVDHVV
jgi:DNA (cytosine-5)-methyltransferase 1